MSSNTPPPGDGRGNWYTRGCTRAHANQNQNRTADFGVTRRSVHVESITQPHESTRQEEYHDH
jgi:hypothetical protein